MREVRRRDKGHQTGVCPASATVPKVVVWTVSVKDGLPIRITDTGECGVGRGVASPGDGRLASTRGRFSARFVTMAGKRGRAWRSILDLWKAMMTTRSVGYKPCSMREQARGRGFVRCARSVAASQARARHRTCLAYPPGSR